MTKEQKSPFIIGQRVKHWLLVSDFKNTPTRGAVQTHHTIFFLLYAGSIAQFLELISAICCSFTRHLCILQEQILLDVRNSWQHNLTHCLVLLALPLGSEKQQRAGSELGHY